MVWEEYEWIEFRLNIYDVFILCTTNVIYISWIKATKCHVLFLFHIYQNTMGAMYMCFCYRWLVVSIFTFICLVMYLCYSCLMWYCALDLYVDVLTGFLICFGTNMSGALLLCQLLVSMLEFTLPSHGKYFFFSAMQE